VGGCLVNVGSGHNIILWPLFLGCIVCCLPGALCCSWCFIVWALGVGYFASIACVVLFVVWVATSSAFVW
jgi:hypothetical protein